MREPGPVKTVSTLEGLSETRLARTLLGQLKARLGPVPSGVARIKNEATGTEIQVSTSFGRDVIKIKTTPPEEKDFVPLMAVSTLSYYDTQVRSFYCIWLCYIELDADGIPQVKTDTTFATRQVFADPMTPLAFTRKGPGLFHWSGEASDWNNGTWAVRVERYKRGWNGVSLAPTLAEPVYPSVYTYLYERTTCRHPAGMLCIEPFMESNADIGQVVVHVSTVTGDIRLQVIDSAERYPGGFYCSMVNVGQSEDGTVFYFGGHSFDGEVEDVGLVYHLVDGLFEYLFTFNPGSSSLPWYGPALTVSKDYVVVVHQNYQGENAGTTFTVDCHVYSRQGSLLAKTTLIGPLPVNIAFQIPPMEDPVIFDCGSRYAAPFIGIQDNKYLLIIRDYLINHDPEEGLSFYHDSVYQRDYFGIKNVYEIYEILETGEVVLRNSGFWPFWTWTNTWASRILRTRFGASLYTLAPKGSLYDQTSVTYNVPGWL